MGTTLTEKVHERPRKLRLPTVRLCGGKDLLGKLRHLGLGNQVHLHALLVHDLGGGDGALVLQGHPHVLEGRGELADFGPRATIATPAGTLAHRYEGARLFLKRQLSIWKDPIGGRCPSSRRSAHRSLSRRRTDGRRAVRISSPCTAARGGTPVSCQGSAGAAGAAHKKGSA